MEPACGRGGALAFVFAYFPASAKGGGAANLGGGGPRGGDASRGGVASLGISCFAAATGLLEGGGAGGAPRPRPAGTTF